MTQRELELTLLLNKAVEALEIIDDAIANKELVLGEDAPEDCLEKLAIAAAIAVEVSDYVHKTQH